jgi:hypothetical protein
MTLKYSILHPNHGGNHHRDRELNEYVKKKLPNRLFIRQRSTIKVRQLPVVAEAIDGVRRKSVLKFINGTL